MQYARRHQFRTLADTAVDGPADHRLERRQLRRAAPRRHELGRLRLQPGHLAGDRQPDLAARQAQLQGGDRRAVHRRRPHPRRAVPLHLPQQRRLPRGKERHQSVRLHHAAAALRPAGRQLQLRLLRPVRAGRLAGQRPPEGALRVALRRVRRAGGADVRGQHALRRFHHRQEQHRPAGRAVVVARRSGDDRAARVDRAHVRAAAARLLRQRDPQQRRSDQLYGVAERHVGRGAGVPEQPGVRATRVRAAASEHYGGRRRTSAPSPRG